MILPGRHHINALVILLFLILGTSCTRQLPAFHALAPLPAEGICRVAVLPFINETHFDDGVIIFHRLFNTELTELDNFQISQEGDIREAFRKERISPGIKRPTIDQLRILGNYLNVQLLIIGYVTEIVEAGGKKGVKDPQITVKLEVMDAFTGQTLWSTYHRRSGSEYTKIMHFGFVSTFTRLSSRMSQEILERWVSEGLIAQCSE
jgi:hypothetical protein